MIQKAAHGVRRVEVLDVLRLISAIFVMFCHYTATYPKSPEGANLSHFFYPHLSFIFRFGYLGVPLFFMISGFVIFMSVENKTPSQFVRSRFIRLYPTFWVCLLITCLFEVFWGHNLYPLDLKTILLNITMVPQYFDAQVYNPAYWTLAVEMTFYILIFCMVLTKTSKNILSYIFVFLCISVMFNLLYIFNEHLYLLINRNVASFIRLVPWFAVGIIHYLIFRDGSNPVKKSLLRFAYVICLYNNAMYNIPVWADQVWQMSSSAYEYVILISSVVIIGFFAFFHTISNHFWIIKNKVSLLMGGVSYPLYLLHINIGLSIIDRYASYVNSYVVLSLTALFICVLSLFVYYVFERNLGKLLRYRF